MTQSRINPNVVHAMDAEMHNKQMQVYAELGKLIKSPPADFAGIVTPRSWQQVEPFKLTQAAQFNGPMNSLIAEYVRHAIFADYSYAEYVQYAQAYSTAAVISEPEYSHAKRHEAMQAWREAVNSSNLAKGIDDSFFKALAHGACVMEVSVDEQDNILLKHWDANMIYKDAVPEMLFNQRNHTQ